MLTSNDVRGYVTDLVNDIKRPLKAFRAIVPPWKSVMGILPLLVYDDGKGDTVFFIALCEKPPHPKWRCLIFHKNVIQ